jgi:hypothetical protein
LNEPNLENNSSLPEVDSPSLYTVQRKRYIMIHSYAMYIRKYVGGDVR